MAEFKVQYQFDEGYWCAEVPMLKGCFTIGPTLDEARENIREVIAGMVSVEVAADAELVDDITLPEAIGRALKSAQKKVREVDDVAQLLAEFGLPPADVTGLLGVVRI